MVSNEFIVLLKKTWVQVGKEPIKTNTSNAATKISRFRPSVLGYSSQSAVIIASSPPNVLSNPRVISIMKKMMDQKFGTIMLAIASGYTMKINPGPVKYQCFSLVFFSAKISLNSSLTKKSHLQCLICQWAYLAFWTCNPAQKKLQTQQGNSSNNL